MNRIGNQPPVGGSSDGGSPLNPRSGKLRGRTVSMVNQHLNMGMQVAPRSGNGSLKGRVKVQKTAEFVTGTNFALRHMPR
ncbi:MAG: hypothetical protein S4CHLAM6_06040 [Chlamydiae bacterium]|nr:hypothetical protein [Chlamydiota bacterium]